MLIRDPKAEFFPEEHKAAGSRRGKQALSTWYDRLRGLVLKNRDPASRSYRYMSRLIEREFHRADAGVCLAFSSPDSDKITADAMLMLAYCLQSELDARVLIVDARLRDQSVGITGRLGFENLPGYADILQDDLAAKARLVQSTTVANVAVLPAGNPRGAMPVERVKLRRLIDAATAKYDYVLLQVGSVLGDTRSLVTVAEADAVFIFAEENRTLMKSLDECRSLLLNNGVKDVRVVISGKQP